LRAHPDNPERTIRLLLVEDDTMIDEAVLDLGLPRQDALAMLVELRKRGNRRPVPIATARDAVRAPAPNPSTRMAT